MKVKLGTDAFPLAVFICSEIEIDDTGKIVACIPSPDCDYHWLGEYPFIDAKGLGPMIKVVGTSEE